ncbi:hypothetical protein J3B02_001847 [Coemansia erecta]|nr:hypothetical protein J3B02_001847 [Coemansia erecta]KAJ2857992.1 hypothetical protein FB639_005957 [Coemansia asiatica]
MASELSYVFRDHKENKMHWEQGAVYDLSWSSDGSMLAAVGAKGSARSWRLERGGHKEGEELKALGSNIERLAWCPASHSTHLLAAAAYERTVHLWDQRTNNVDVKLSTNGTNSDICWSPSGRYFAVVSKDDGKLEIFDVGQPQSPVVVAEIDEIVCSVRWNPQETMVLLATHQGAVEVFEWPSMRHLTAVNGHAASCNCIAFDSCGRTMATGGADAAVQLWNAADFSPTHAIAAHQSPLLFVDFNMDDRFVASASDDLSIRIHEAFSGELAHSLDVDSLTTAVKWHPRNLALAYGSAGSSKASAKPSVTILLKA